MAFDAPFGRFVNDLHVPASVGIRLFVPDARFAGRLVFDLALLDGLYNQFNAELSRHVLLGEPTMDNDMEVHPLFDRLVGDSLAPVKARHAVLQVLNISIAACTASWRAEWWSERQIRRPHYPQHSRFEAFLHVLVALLAGRGVNVLYEHVVNMAVPKVWPRPAEPGEVLYQTFQGAPVFRFEALQAAAKALLAPSHVCHGQPFGTPEEYEQFVAWTELGPEEADRITAAAQHELPRLKDAYRYWTFALSGNAASRPPSARAFIALLYKLTQRLPLQPTTML